MPLQPGHEIGTGAPRADPGVETRRRYCPGPAMQSPLLLDRRFAPLFWCQFLAAFGDNLLRYALGLLALWSPEGARNGWMVAAAAGAFVAPSMLVSALGGTLADRGDKALLARRLKAADIAVAALALLALGINSLPLLFTSLIAAGVVAALFGPAKYAILPDQLTRERLPGANALVEAATFAAILGGSLAGGLILGNGAGSPGQRLAIGLLLLLVSVLSWLSARRIPRQPAAASAARERPALLAGTLSPLRGLGRGPVRRAALGNAWFWMVGSAVLSLTPGLVHGLAGGTPLLASLCLCMSAAGIAGGSALASRLSGGRIVLLLAAFGAGLTGLSLLHLGLAGAAPPIGRLLADLFLAAAGGGLVAVPTLAAVQAGAAPERRAGAIAGTNVLAATGMALTAALLVAAQGAGLGELRLLALVGAASLLAVPAMLARLCPNPAGELCWVLLRLVYRVELRGAEHLPSGGSPAIVTPNHVSWLDATLLFSVMDRPLYAIDAGVSRLWFVRPFLRVVDAVAVDAAHPLSMRRLIEAVRAGRPAVIFPEGRITSTGSMMRVQDGAAMAAERAGALIVPARIEGLEATMFSRLCPRPGAAPAVPARAARPSCRRGGWWCAATWPDGGGARPRRGRCRT